MNFLIIGASGFIGSALFDELSASHRVQGTYCSTPLANLLRFDLTVDPPEALPVDWSRLDAVVLASAITAIEECALDPARTQQLNVAAVERFCSFLARRGVALTYLSTDYVYEGTPHPGGTPRLYREDEGLSPTTQYGRQKLAAEQLVQANIPVHLIARLAKTVSVRGSRVPFGSWAESLRRGERLRLANDWVHGISWVRDTVRALSVALENRLVGVYNICGPTFCSRFEWGRMVCEAIGADPSLVVPCSVDDLGFREQRPRDLSLDVSRFESAVPFRFSATGDVLCELRAR